MSMLKPSYSFKNDDIPARWEPASGSF